MLFCTLAFRKLLRYTYKRLKQTHPLTDEKRENSWTNIFLMNFPSQNEHSCCCSRKMVFLTETSQTDPVMFKAWGQLYLS